MRSLLLIILAASACCAQDTNPTTPIPPATVAPTANAPGIPGDEATRIAVEIIRARARDAEAGGQAALATQLDALAKGLVDSRVTLYDASLVMQIAAAPKPSASTMAAPLSQEGKASVRRATSLLDGDSSAAPTPAGPTAVASAPSEAPAVATGPTPTPTTLPNQPAQPKRIATKVYAVDIGSSGKANVAAIGAGAKQGVIVNQRFAINRGNLSIATCKIIRVSDALSYGEIVKGSLVDPNDDVKEGDQAVLVP